MNGIEKKKTQKYICTIYSTMLCIKNNFTICKISQKNVFILHTITTTLMTIQQKNIYTNKGKSASTEQAFKVWMNNNNNNNEENIISFSYVCIKLLIFSLLSPYYS